MKLSPARLDPVFVPRIWGAKTLAPLFPETGTRQSTSEIPIGEVWLTGDACRVTSGDYAGRTLGEAWRAMPAEWAGTRLDTRSPFPLLAKFLFPEDKLSVQVHPGDDYAREHEADAGGVGKTEMWYAVSARTGAEIFVGLRPGVTRQTLVRAIEEGTAEECLSRIRIAAGDAAFVPAGTAHTIGPGSVLFEIQENSDLTYRIFDYNRRNPDGTPRALHIERALEVLDFGEQRGGKVQPVRTADGCCEVTYFVACRYFALEKWQFVSARAFESDPERFELLIVIGGAGRLAWDGGASDYGVAQAWVVPAALGSWRIEPSARTTLLRAFVPDLKRYAEQLKARGVSALDVEQIIRP